ncbi:MAG TPA: hypothetical protein VFQ44_20555 [Streptosporangiaceae bacterium]|nr:hypothetical protein [Streptosporangiaceae bacterium]
MPVPALERASATPSAGISKYRPVIKAAKTSAAVALWLPGSRIPLHAPGGAGAAPPVPCSPTTA